ncbi:MAG: hypothetical protein N3E49_01515 [Bacteroidia bacterium]|nr:hypothetical protein [Bacteroidia bacterium]
MRRTEVVLALTVLLKGLWAQNRSALYERAQGWTRRGQSDSALAIWRSLLLIERDSMALALIYQQLGLVALQRRDSVEALRLWKKSLHYHPAYTVARQNYGWLYSKLRRPPEESPLERTLYEPHVIPLERNPPFMGSRHVVAKPKTVLWLLQVRGKEP